MAAALNAFMRQGGIILFDTRDEGSGEGFAPGARAALRRITRDLSVPPLAPVPEDHVLRRAFYLLQDRPGRFSGGTVWVAREQDRANDSVSPVIIGGHDWAAAWAVDARGNTPYAVIPGGATFSAVLSRPVSSPTLRRLREELRQVPADGLLFLTHTGGRPYKPETLGNWFKDQCHAAGLPHCSAHGLRKAGARRIAESGGTEHEVMSFMAHATPKEGATYTRKASRAIMADSAMAKVAGLKREQKLSNLSERLDKSQPQPVDMKGRN
jgi:hypothetical protein